MAKLSVNLDTVAKTIEVLIDGQVPADDINYIEIYRSCCDEGPHFTVGTHKEVDGVYTRTHISANAKLIEDGAKFLCLP